MELPKYIPAAKQGEDGITILKSIIEIQLEWIFRPNHKEHDFGIDAYIDIISEVGQITGKSIAIQVKTGDSFFKETNNYGWVYRGHMSHLNYYLNHEIPVLIILVNEKEKKAYWCSCDPNQTEKAGDSWKITIPFNKELKKESKSELIQFVSPVRDYVSQLEHFWSTNKLLKQSDRLILIVDKSEIVDSQFQSVAKVINRLQVNKELIESKKNTVDIWFHGYNDDPRELYEINEIKDWVNKFLAIINGWSYFFYTGEGSVFLRIAQFSNMEFSVGEESENSKNGRKQRKIIFDLKTGVPFLNSFFADLNSFCYKYNISDDINIEICKRVTRYLACDAPNP